MRKILQNLWLIVSLATIIPLSALACHKGGSMGYASGDPIMSTTDYLFVPTFTIASTSGTLGCENWDVVSLLQVEYVAANWAPLAEDSAKGAGPHLDTLSQLMGCQKTNPDGFNAIIHSNYPFLFEEYSQISAYEKPHLFQDRLKTLMQQSGVRRSCDIQPS